MVKRRGDAVDVEQKIEQTSGCSWTKHDNMFSNGYAVNFTNGLPNLETLSFSVAQSRCLAVGNPCQAITCSGSMCTLRATAELQPSQLETTWVPSCHKCSNLAGNYWTTDISNNSDFLATFQQRACGGNVSVTEAGFPIASRNYYISGSTLVSWNPWLPDVTVNGSISGTPGAFAIGWTDGWGSLQCPYVEGVYEASTPGFEPSQVTLTQTGCAGTWAPASESWQTTNFSLLPSFKIQTIEQGGNIQGDISFDQGFFKIVWDSYTWQQLDASTTTLAQLWR